MKENEFWIAFNHLSKATGTIACGCQMTDEEEADALILWRNCKEYVETYHKMKMPW